MRQVIQNFRTGELKVEDVPPPVVRPSGLLVQEGVLTTLEGVRE